MWHVPLLLLLLLLLLPEVQARSQSGPPGADSYATDNSLSPMMIPPPCHLSRDLHHHRPTSPLPVPKPSRRTAIMASPIVVGSYDPSESLLGSSPQNSHVGGSAVDGEFSKDISAGLFRLSESGKFDLASVQDHLPLLAITPSLAVVGATDFYGLRVIDLDEGFVWETLVWENVTRFGSTIQAIDASSELMFTSFESGRWNSSCIMVYDKGSLN